MEATADMSVARGAVEARHGARVEDMERPAPMVRGFGQEPHMGYLVRLRRYGDIYRCLVEHHGAEDG
jgi:hypothetical protein